MSFRSSCMVLALNYVKDMSIYIDEKQGTKNLDSVNVDF